MARPCGRSALDSGFCEVWSGVGEGKSNGWICSATGPRIPVPVYRDKRKGSARRTDERQSGGATEGFDCTIALGTGPEYTIRLRGGFWGASPEGNGEECAPSFCLLSLSLFPVFRVSRPVWYGCAAPSKREKGRKRGNRVVLN